MKPYPAHPFKLFVPYLAQKHADWFSVWIDDPSFDDKNTFNLVKSFQKEVGLNESGEPDGIVGLSTYIALKLSFNYFGDFSDPTVKKQLIKQIKRDLEKIPISLRNIPPVIPDLVLQSLFEILESTAFEQIRNEIKNKDDLLEKTLFQDKEKFALVDFKPDIFANFFFDILFKEFLNKEWSDEDADFEQLKKYLSNTEESIDEDVVFEQLKKYLSGFKLNSNELQTKEGLDRILKLVQAEYLAIEPIMTLMLKISSPLALYQDNRGSDFTASLKFILGNYERKLTNFKARLNLSEDASELFQNYNDNTLEELKDFASTAVNKFSMLLLESLKWFLEKWKINKNQDKEFQLTIYFYFLLSKLEKKIKKTPSQKYKAPFDFAKKEFLVMMNKIEIDNRVYQDFYLTSAEREEYELTIPVNRTYLDSQLTSDNTPNQVQYSFLPYAVDLSYWCSTVEEQGAIKSCSAFAGVGLLEYFAKRTSGNYRDLSSLFLYKAARNLMQVSEDRGASLRETMRAMEKFGVPPAEYWPYLPEKINEEPPQFCYAFASNYQALKYFRLDYAGISEEALLQQVKAVLAAGFPCAFGFALYVSAGEEENVKRGWFPLPDRNERCVGGHAVVAVGYNDFETVGFRQDNPLARGALLVRNCWGTDWGKKGYGWLPYQYVLEGLTADWWMLLDANWFEEESPERGATASIFRGSGPPTKSPKPSTKPK